jgi:hypothetical protein
VTVREIERSTHVQCNQVRVETRTQGKAHAPDTMNKTDEMCGHGITFQICLGSLVEGRSLIFLHLLALTRSFALDVIEPRLIAFVIGAGAHNEVVALTPARRLRCALIHEPHASGCFSAAFAAQAEETQNSAHFFDSI